MQQEFYTGGDGKVVAVDSLQKWYQPQYQVLYIIYIMRSSCGVSGGDLIELVIIPVDQNIIYYLTW